MSVRQPPEEETDGGVEHGTPLEKDGFVLVRGFARTANSPAANCTKGA